LAMWQPRLPPRPPAAMPSGGDAAWHGADADAAAGGRATSCRSPPRAFFGARGEAALVSDIVALLAEGPMEVNRLSAKFAMVFNEEVRGSPLTPYSAAGRNDGNFKRWLMKCGFQVGPIFERNRAFVFLPCGIASAAAGEDRTGHGGGIKAAPASSRRPRAYRGKFPSAGRGAAPPESPRVEGPAEEDVPSPSDALAPRLPPAAAAEALRDAGEAAGWRRGGEIRWEVKQQPCEATAASPPGALRNSKEQEEPQTPCPFDATQVHDEDSTEDGAAALNDSGGGPGMHDEGAGGSGGSEAATEEEEEEDSTQDVAVALDDDGGGPGARDEGAGGGSSGSCSGSGSDSGSGVEEENDDEGSDAASSEACWVDVAGSADVAGWGPRREASGQEAAADDFVLVHEEDLFFEVVNDVQF